MTNGLFTSGDFSLISSVAISAIISVLPYALGLFAIILALRIALKVLKNFEIGDTGIGYDSYEHKFYSNYSNSGHWLNKFKTTKANIYKPIYRTYTKAKKEQAEIYRAINS